MRRTKPYDIDYMTGQNEENDILTEENKEAFPPQWETNGPETKNGTIAGSLLVKLRKEASFDSDVLETLTNGEVVSILERGNVFHKVLTKSNREGYVFSKYIKEE